MTTTPKQLQAWREEFYKSFPARPLSASHQAVTDNDYVFAGYLRRCQETEQIMKLAKFGAMVMDSKLLMRHDYGTIDRAIEAGLLSDNDKDGLVLRNIEYVDGTEATIKDLLNGK